MPEAPCPSLRSAHQDDAAAIASIYNDYVIETVATFEAEPVNAAEMSSRLADIEDRGLPWLVAEVVGEVVGYAYAAPWRSRAAYRRSVEISTYLRPDATGRGLGTALYRELFVRLQDCGAHAVMAGIALPNDASVALHEKFGMRRVAHFREVGHKFGSWIDVAYWQVVPDTN